jgi:hypothetical protein
VVDDLFAFHLGVVDEHMTAQGEMRPLANIGAEMGGK